MTNPYRYLFNSYLRYFYALENYYAYRTYVGAALVWLGRQLNRVPIVGQLLGAIIRILAEPIDFIVSGLLNVVTLVGALCLSPFSHSARQTVSAFFKNSWLRFKQAFKQRSLSPLTSPFLISHQTPAQPARVDINNFNTLTLNTALLREELWQGAKLMGKGDIVHGMLSPSQRIAKVIHYLEQHQDKDVICLQEAFDLHSQQAIVAALKAHFPYAVFNVGDRDLGVGSGLMILSKHPLSNVEFHRYPNLTNIDTLSNKGFLKADVVLGKHRLSVYNTHTQAGGKQSSHRRNHELGMIHAHIEKTKHQNQNNANYLGAQLMGDINASLNHEAKLEGKSGGKKPGRIKGQVKSPQLAALMRLFRKTNGNEGQFGGLHPDNFSNVRTKLAMLALYADKKALPADQRWLAFAVIGEGEQGQTLYSLEEQRLSANQLVSLEVTSQEVCVHRSASGEAYYFEQAKENTKLYRFIKRDTNGEAMAMDPREMKQFIQVVRKGKHPLLAKLAGRDQICGSSMDSSPLAARIKAKRANRPVQPVEKSAANGKLLDINAVTASANYKAHHVTHLEPAVETGPLDGEAPENGITTDHHGLTGSTNFSLGT